MPQSSWFERNMQPATPPQPPSGGWFAQQLPAPTAPATAAPVSATDDNRIGFLGHVRGFLQQLNENANPGPAIVAASRAANAALQRTLAGDPLGATGELIDKAGKMASDLGWAHNAVLDRAVESYKAGRYGEAGRHIVNFMTPVLGPGLDKAGTLMAEGKYGEGLGIAAGLGSQIAGPAMLSRMRGTRLPGPLRNPNALERSAVAFAEREGIPVDLAAASGNQFVGGVQKATEYTPLGSVSSRSAALRQTEALTATGRRLAERTGAAPATPLTSGQSVASGVEAQAAGFGREADRTYAQLRAFERDPANTQTVSVPQTGRLKGAPVTVQRQVAMGLPVDIGAAKKALRPLFEELSRENSIVQLQGARGRGLVALDRLMQADSMAPLTVVDGALGELKAMLRKAPAGNVGGRRVLSDTIGELGESVNAAAAKGGPKVVAALREGRAATVSRYLAEDVLSGLRKGDVGVFDQLIGPRDANIAALRDVAAYAPETVPGIGRAYLDMLLDTATAEGAFGHVDQLWARWTKLGPETKKILFPDSGHVQALNDFFLVAKRIGRNPNASGTALVTSALKQISNVAQVGAAVMNPVEGAVMLGGAGLLAAAFRSPRVVRLLTRGMTLRVGPTVAKAAWMGELAQALQQARGRPMMAAPVPAVAEQAAAPGPPR